jgi:hypothetical protein
MTTLIIEPKNEADYQLFVSLAKRLKVKFREQAQTDDEPTKVEILQHLKEDYVALQKGTLKTRPASDFLAELKKEGLL